LRLFNLKAEGQTIVIINRKHDQKDAKLKNKIFANPGLVYSGSEQPGPTAVSLLIIYIVSSASSLVIL